jgi:hypothetical protein
MATEQRIHQGALSNTTLPSLIYSVLRRGDTGILRFQDHGVEKVIYIRGGRPLFASSTDPEDRLGNRFLKAGRISLAGLLAAAEKSDVQKKRMGTVLVEVGLIAPGDLVEGVLAQVKGIILSLFQWAQGRYIYTPGPLPTDEVITLKLNADRLTLEGVRGIDRWGRVWEAVGPLDARYQVVKGSEERTRALDLSRQDAVVLSRLEGPVSLHDLCNPETMSDFDLCRLLWALKTLGLIKRV